MNTLFHPRGWKRVIISVSKVALTAYFIETVSKTGQNITDADTDTTDTADDTSAGLLGLFARDPRTALAVRQRDPASAARPVRAL